MERPSSVAQSGRPDGKLRETRGQRCRSHRPTPDFAALNPGYRAAIKDKIQF
jgi:hypothetical protein